nr:Uma2 family endonuclease [Streptomyces sp. 846.5]
MGEMARIWETFEPPEGVRAELLAGEIVMQANPVALHNLIIRNIVRSVDGSIEAWGEQGVELSEDSKPRPDVVLVYSEDVMLGDTRDWPAGIVQVVVEIISAGRRAWKDDWITKRDEYAEAGIPRYLIIDPRQGTWHMLILQDNGEYKEQSTGPFGAPVPTGLFTAEDVMLTLETTAWQQYPTP